MTLRLSVRMGGDGIVWLRGARSEHVHHHMLILEEVGGKLLNVDQDGLIGEQLWKSSEFCGLVLEV